MLDLLPPKELARVLGASIICGLGPGEQIDAPNRLRRFVHFPVDSQVSIMLSMSGGEEIELLSVGREGLVGSRSLIVQERGWSPVLCSLPGAAYRMGAADFRGLAGPGSRLRAEVLRFHVSVISAESRISACNRFHVPLQRCARWLLLAGDRAAGRPLEITHELLARLVGMHRPAASTALAQLQRAGAVKGERGRITIRSRERLQALACECYAALRGELRLPRR